MTEAIIGIAIGLAATVIGYLCGFFTCLHAFKSGANMIDRIHHDQVPFDSDLDPDGAASHVDGVSLDEDE